MGCYDTVEAHCTVCGNVLKFKSKAGNCNLDVYNMYSVPATIAEDLSIDIEDNYEFCSNCKTAYRLFANVPFVAMNIIKIVKVEELV